MERDLDLDDLDDQEGLDSQQHQLQLEISDQDIFADNNMEDDECCQGCRTNNDDIGQESTFISNLPEPEHSYEIAPFDYSVDMYLDTSLIKSKPVLQRISSIVSESRQDKGDIPDKDEVHEQPQYNINTITNTTTTYLQQREPPVNQLLSCLRDEHEDGLFMDGRVNFEPQPFTFLN